MQSVRTFFIKIFFVIWMILFLCFSGMYKDNESGTCKFCPPKTYSNGTSDKCHPCSNDLSLLPGLYYKIWNELPTDFERLYMSFEEGSSGMYINFLSFIQ